MFGDILSNNNNENVIEEKDSIEDILDKMSDDEVLESIYVLIGGFDDTYDDDHDNDYFGGYDDEFGYNGRTS